MVHQSPTTGDQHFITTRVHLLVKMNKANTCSQVGVKTEVFDVTQMKKGLHGNARSPCIGYRWSRTDHAAEPVTIRIQARARVKAGHELQISLNNPARIKIVADAKTDQPTVFNFLVSFKVHLSQAEGGIPGCAPKQVILRACGPQTHKKKYNHDNSGDAFSYHAKTPVMRHFTA